MHKTQKREYTSPMVEQFDARVERGFEASNAVDPQPTAGSTESLLGSGQRYNGNDFD